ncbi:DMT family transporter [Pseudogemmobacter humi]|uniref:Riboflavin transporter n=1 Tax=Pseudogemmobacter humi TaxID=2483812 RepID=A0A3P5XFX6_9RHOB|nr:DMT family transporter [Pseudogemmobacter humi]VDC30347.1 Riboflavin transporter [Pseudogemmobacter humi]
MNVQTLVPDRTMAAVGLTVTYAAMVGFSDNFVRLVADETGLSQFHFTRSLMALAIIGLVAPFLGLRLRAVRPWAVMLRAVLQGTAIFIYFGALAFLPVALAAAGLFTAPIFVLLISRFAFGEAIGPVRILAVALGFLGVVLVLGPAALAGATLAAVLPVAAAVVYALSNIVTRKLCAQETPETLLAAFFVVLGLYGVIGMAVFALWPLPVPAGSDGFVLRGAVWPDARYLGLMALQAFLSAVGVGMCTRAYQLADTGRVSVIEYMVLPSSAFWGWILWDESLGWRAWAGIALIVLAGAMIALRAHEAARHGEAATG